MTFDIDSLRAVYDYGTTTISEYDWGTSWNSPITSLIPMAPSSGAYGGVPRSYTFPNVSDYSSTFIEEAASQGNSYGYNDGVYSTYHIELRASRRSAPRNGDGTSDYPFTRASLLEFYREFASSDRQAYFNESYSRYRIVDGKVTYLEGLSWSSYDVQIMGIQDKSIQVPEPAGLALFVIGLCAYVFTQRRA